MISQKQRINRTQYQVLCFQKQLWHDLDLTLSMLGLLSSMGEKCKTFCKPSKPCHVGIHWKDLAQYSRMSTHMPWFKSFPSFFASFCFDQISHQQHKG